MSHPETDPYAVTSWGDSKEPFDVVTPSGQRCLVRKLEMEDMLSSGILNDLDSFSAILLADDADTESEADPKEMIKAFSDKEKFGKMIGTIDKVIVLTVLRPVISPVPKEGVAREIGKVYTNSINMMDKMFIFSKVFDGLGGMDTFREGQEAGVGTVENEQALPTTPEPIIGAPA